MRFLIRTDASVNIGTGHVVRCATLAKALLQLGHEISFLCRDLPGNLNQWLETRGFVVTRMTGSDDADAVRALAAAQRFDWLIVDHYGLGAGWETLVASVVTRILSIDDLGRTHDCDLLLDQNYPNPVHALYKLTERCERLLGPQFALVRSEFAALRFGSLARMRTKLDRVLVFMGGSDPHNETSKALNGIALTARPHMMVDVVIGEANPHRISVESACLRLPHAQVHVQTPRMAELMAQADLAICAGGSATWERCVLGLPALVTVLADNQAPISEAMAAAGAQLLLGAHERLSPEDYARAIMTLTPDQLGEMSRVAAGICDGRGTERVSARLTQGIGGSKVAEGTLHA
jgi:UDP-2,4-diacetamido-2,4,6-trideoxy-beta-L-altropyranose hydrolase